MTINFAIHFNKKLVSY